MKKIYTTFLFFVIAICLKATSYTITISGFTYSPPTLTVAIGDVVKITASGNHPLAEVSQTTWNANGTATLSTGFGFKTSAHTLTITSSNTIYYVCTNHVSGGMKGQIVVSSTTGIKENLFSLKNVSLFPNPARDKFTVSYNASESGTASVKLYSISGEELQGLCSEKEINVGENNFTIPIQKSIPNGIYFVELTYQSKKQVLKLVVN